MHVLTLLAAFVACWALTNLWLLPLVHSSWRGADILGKVKRAATLTFLEKARDLAATGTITMGLLAIIIGTIALLGEGSAISTKSMMETLFGPAPLRWTVYRLNTRALRPPLAPDRGDPRCGATPSMRAARD